MNTFINAMIKILWMWKREYIGTLLPFFFLNLVNEAVDENEFSADEMSSQQDPFHHKYEREFNFKTQRDISRILRANKIFKSTPEVRHSPKAERHLTQLRQEGSRDFYSGSVVIVIRHSCLTERDENVSRYGIKEAFVGRPGIDPSYDGTASAVASRKIRRGKHQ